MERPIPFSVLRFISEMRYWERGNDHYPRNALAWPFNDEDKYVVQEARRVIESIGGAWKPKEINKRLAHYVFDYDASMVIGDILSSGAIPDHKSHQYYPTPPSIAEEVVDLAGIEAHHSCLEPSAGQGAIAEFLPKDRTLCVEVSGLHCQVLQAKGYAVEHADFLEWSACIPDLYDRIVMNPPFSQGRAIAHLEAAAEMLATGGRLVAILPASMRNKDILPWYRVTWTNAHENKFAGTSISTVILVAEREY